MKSPPHRLQRTRRKRRAAEAKRWRDRPRGLNDRVSEPGGLYDIEAGFEADARVVRFCRHYWILGASGFSSGLRWERPLFLIPYVAIVGAFLFLYFRSTSISLKQLIDRWPYGLIGAAAATFLS